MRCLWTLGYSWLQYFLKIISFFTSCSESGSGLLLLLAVSPITIYFQKATNVVGIYIGDRSRDWRNIRDVAATLSDVRLCFFGRVGHMWLLSEKSTNCCYFCSCWLFLSVIPNRQFSLLGFLFFNGTFYVQNLPFTRFVYDAILKCDYEIYVSPHTLPLFHFYTQWCTMGRSWTELLRKYILTHSTNYRWVLTNFRIEICMSLFKM